MAFAFMQDAPAGWEGYQRVRAAVDRQLHGERPAGLVLHLVWDDGPRLRFLDVWESQEAFQRFEEGTLRTVVGPALAEAGLPPPPPPERTALTVREVWIGPAARATEARRPARAQPGARRRHEARGHS